MVLVRAMLPGKTAVKNKATPFPINRRYRLGAAAIVAPRAISTTPEPRTTLSGSAGNQGGTWAWNSWRAMVR